MSGPGEYEVQEIFIRGVPSTSRYGGKERINTIYAVTLEEMKLCFIGAMSDRKLPTETKEVVAGADVLFVPVGGDGVLTPGDAHELAVELEAKMVIPIHYPTSAGNIGEADALAKFLKASGKGNISPVEKLTLKRKDLDGKEEEVVVLSV